MGKYTTPTTPTTYIYIISKVFDDDIYFKVGEGGKGSSSGVGRLGDAQTYLSPGLENAGYKVHYVFFFRKNLHNNSVTIGQHIEKKIHKVLRYYFKPTNISHTNDEPSEWYLLKNSKEEIFFLGFVFDIIGCYNHEKTKPLEIWKYTNKKGKMARTNVKLMTGVASRMRLNNTYREIENKLGEFQLRKRERPIGTIIDNNDAVVYEEQLNEIKRYFGFPVRDTRQSQEKQKTPYMLEFPDLQVHLKDFRTFSISTLEKYSKFFAVLNVENDNKSKLYDILDSKKIEYIEDDDYNVLIRLKDFLVLYKDFFEKNNSDWSLQQMLDFYSTKEYENKIKEIPVKREQIPSWFSSRPVQLYWAKKMVDGEENNNEFKYHKDYDIENSDILKNWKVYGYDTEDGVRLKRYQVDGNKNEIPNTHEEVNILRVMKRMNVYKPEDLVKSSLKKTYEVLKEIRITDNSKKGEHIILKTDDMIEIRDDYFLWYDKYGEPDGLEHKEWRSYKIKNTYKKLQYDLSMNPWIDVIEINKDNSSPNEIYELIANSFMDGRIRKLGSGNTKIDPKFEKSQIILFSKQNSKTLFENIAWKKQEHYISIEQVKKRNQVYIIRVMSPFQYKQEITFSKMHEHVKETQLVDKTDVKLKDYKDKLLYTILNIDHIESHIPKTAKDHLDLIKEGRRNPKYELKYENNEENIKTKQNAILVDKYAPRKVTQYWSTRKVKPTNTRITQKIKKNSPRYEFETFDDEIDRAKTNWADIHNDNIRAIAKKKSAFSREIYSHDGKLDPFSVGDIFISGGKNPRKGFIVNHFYNKTDKAMTYGIFFSDNPNQPTGKYYKEYTQDKIVDLLKEGNTIPYLEKLEANIYTKMLNKYKKIDSK